MSIGNCIVVDAFFTRAALQTSCRATKIRLLDGAAVCMVRFLDSIHRIGYKNVLHFTVIFSMPHVLAVGPEKHPRTSWHFVQMGQTMQMPQCALTVLCSNL
jgi:hypothetical protein